MLPSKTTGFPRGLDRPPQPSGAMLTLILTHLQLILRHACTAAAPTIVIYCSESMSSATREVIYLRCGAALVSEIHAPWAWCVAPRGGLSCCELYPPPRASLKSCAGHDRVDLTIGTKAGDTRRIPNTCAALEVIKHTRRVLIVVHNAPTLLAFFSTDSSENRDRAAKA